MYKMTCKCGIAWESDIKDLKCKCGRPERDVGFAYTEPNPVSSAKAEAAKAEAAKAEAAKSKVSLSSSVSATNTTSAKVQDT